LGVILYEMLTGRLPFEAKDATELARMHRIETPIPPRQINPDIPQVLEEITLKVLSKEPSARYRTADQLGRVLVSFGTINKEKTGPIDLPQVRNPNGSNHENPEPVLFQPPNTLSEPAPFTQDPDLYAVEEPDEETSIDWVTWLLGILAFTTILGLIPFWLYIYFSLNP